jgi:hypothetical protein
MEFSPGRRESWISRTPSTTNWCLGRGTCGVSRPKTMPAWRRTAISRAASGCWSITGRIWMRQFIFHRERRPLTRFRRDNFLGRLLYLMSERNVPVTQITGFQLRVFPSGRRATGQFRLELSRCSGRAGLHAGRMPISTAIRIERGVCIFRDFCGSGGMVDRAQGKRHWM